MFKWWEEKLYLFVFVVNFGKSFGVGFLFLYIVTWRYEGIILLVFSGGLGFGFYFDFCCVLGVGGCCCLDFFFFRFWFWGFIGFC